MKQFLIAVLVGFGIGAAGASLSGCSGGDWPVPDTSQDTPELSDDAEGSDYGTDEQAYTVASGALNALLPSLLAAPYFDDPGQPFLRQCSTGNGASGEVGCRGHQLTPPASSFQVINTNSTAFQSLLTTFCSQLNNKAQRNCTVSLFSGSTCPGNSAVCIRNQTVTGGGSRPVFDLRRYQQGACTRTNPAMTATFRGISYTAAPCINYIYNVDKAVIIGEGGAQSNALLADVLYSIGLQVTGVGMTTFSLDQANSTTFSVGSNPYRARSRFMTNGQICRVNNSLVTPIDTLAFSDSAGCAND